MYISHELCVVFPVPYVCYSRLPCQGLEVFEASARSRRVRLPLVNGQDDFIVTNTLPPIIFPSACSFSVFFGPGGV
jgi:hypothetical protein